MGLNVILVHLSSNNEVIAIPAELIQSVGEFSLPDNTHPNNKKFHAHTKSYLSYAKDRVEYPYKHENTPLVVNSTTIYLREDINTLLNKLEG